MAFEPFIGRHVRETLGHQRIRDQIDVLEQPTPQSERVDRCRSAEAEVMVGLQERIQRTGDYSTLTGGDLAGAERILIVAGAE